MARGQTNKLYRTFNKGLITEAGFLTYPEDASTDELNTIIHRKGNRSRRFGMDYEPNGVEIAVTGYGPNEVTSEYLWRAANNKSDKNLLCVQIGNIVHFYNAAIFPISLHPKSFTIDLNTYKSPTSTIAQVRSTHVQMASGKGFLFIVQENIDPIVVTYDDVADTITVTKIVIQIRDFDGVNDGLANDAEPATLSNEHHYNLRNQGWVEPGSVPLYGDGETGAESGTGAYSGGGGGIGSSTQVYYDPYSGNALDYQRLGEGGDIP